MRREAVDDLLEVLHGAHVDRHDVAILTGDPAAADDLRGLLGQIADLV